MAFQHINERIVETLAVGQHGGHELRRIIAFQPRGLIRFNAVSRRVSLAEGVTRKTSHQPPNLSNLLVVVSARLGRREELLLNLRNDGALLFVQRPAQHVRAAGRQAGERLADLQNVFLIDHQPERVAQYGFKRWMRIGDRFESLIAPCERELLAFVGRARVG